MKKILSYVLLIVLIIVVIFVFRSEPRRNSVFSLQTNPKETKENAFPSHMNSIAKPFYAVKWDRYDSLLEAVYEFSKVSSKVNENEKKEMLTYLYDQFNNHYDKVIAPAFEPLAEGDIFLLKENFYSDFLPFKVKPTLLDFAEGYCSNHYQAMLDNINDLISMKMVNPAYPKELAKYQMNMIDVSKKITCLGFVWRSEEYRRDIQINEDFIKFYLGNVSISPEPPAPTSY